VHHMQQNIPHRVCSPAPMLFLCAEPDPREGKQDPGCMALQQALLEQIEQLQLPTNFLDELIWELGGPDTVAECTGRKGRVVADHSGR